MIRHSLPLLILATACTTSTDGIYVVDRTVIESDPSPQFAIPDGVPITIDGVAVLVAARVANDVVIDGAHATFVDVETWPSPEGNGSARVTYDVQRSDDELTGIAHATVIYDSPTGFYDFDYTLAIAGEKQ